MQELLFPEIRKLLSSSKPTLILALDGRCASGKTTLGILLQETFPCNLFHMDDFFLRPQQRTAKRLAAPGGNVDYERFLREVLTPLTRGEPVLYRPFDCHSQTLAEGKLIPFRRLNVVEGSYSLHPALRDAYDFTVFCDVDAETQKQRIFRRNGENAPAFFSKWIPLEEAYFSAFDLRHHADLIL